MTCKLWTKSVDGCGYGLKRYEGKLWRVHRLVFFLVHGYLPEVVMHTCDTPACYNKDHLVAGTRDANNKDRASKGRSADNRGEKHGRAILTNHEVRQIKEALREPYKGINNDLAKYYGCSHYTISNIRRGKQWRDI